VTSTIKIQRTEHPKQRPLDKDLGFGTVFTDHMFIANYDEGQGWHSPRVVPYGPLELDPATAVFHYAQGIFDGLKAFRGVDDKVRLFRPDRHVQRMNESAARLCIPPLDPELALDSIASLVATDRDWVPRTIGTSLYIRPTIIATEPFLGVRAAKSYIYFVIMSPVGAYYPKGMAPVDIRVEEQFVRAAIGGLGGVKTGANYAASLMASELAKHEGFTQVLWLDGVHRKYIDEVGTMNIMVKIGDEIVTPPLGGTILPGVTRDSALTLMRRWGLRASERQLSIDEVIDAHRAGELAEVWGTGTAAVISPVGELTYKGHRMPINGGGIGPVTQRLYDSIVAIQYGKAPGPDGWTLAV